MAFKNRLCVHTRMCTLVHTRMCTLDGCGGWFQHLTLSRLTAADWNQAEP